VNYRILTPRFPLLGTAIRLPVFDALVWNRAKLILTAESCILNPFFEASETGSWLCRRGGAHGGVKNRSFAP
jgi:hypothetical protein